MSTDFRVLQTYDEIRQYVRDAAMSVLGDVTDPPGWHDQWTIRMADRIADQAVMHLDAEELA
jgi:hypothetical protein